MNSTVKTIDERLPLRRSTIEPFHSNFGNLGRISTFEAAVAPFKSSPALGLEGIGEFICRQFRVESMRTTAHVISLASTLHV